MGKISFMSSLYHLIIANLRSLRRTTHSGVSIIETRKEDCMMNPSEISEFQKSK